MKEHITGGSGSGKHEKLTNSERVEKLESEASELAESLKTEICDTCVWPYKETDQERMTERCDACPIMKKLDAAMEKARGAGYAKAILDTMESLMEAKDSVFGGAEK